MARFVLNSCPMTLLQSAEAASASWKIMPMIAVKKTPLTIPTSFSAQSPFLLPSRNFSLSQNMDKMSAWEKRKFKGRKPRSLGRAKTKLELVDPDPTLDEEEEKLLAEWKKQYEVDMAHCYDLMKEKAVLESLDTGAEKRWIQEERRHHANMMRENDEWNKEITVIRERDLVATRELEDAQIRASVTASMEAQAARQSEVMAYVDRLQEESQHFVTLDNIEEKVNEALDAAVVDYDFAVDKRGNIIKGVKNSAVLSG